MAKHPTSLRISDYTKAQIEQIAAYMNANQTEAVAMSVASFYRELFGNKNPMQKEEAMNEQQARQLAQETIASLTGVGDYEPVAETTVVIMTGVGRYSVTDNGEQVENLTAEQAVEIIVENLTAEQF